MSVLTGSNAAGLSDELVAARKRYNKKVNSVLTKAQGRRKVVRQAIAGLTAEDKSLADVESAAKQA
jgi:hypothetical protein